MSAFETTRDVVSIDPRSSHEKSRLNGYKERPKLIVVMAVRPNED
jgi:hypothetical protein